MLKKNKKFKNKKSEMVNSLIAWLIGLAALVIAGLVIWGLLGRGQSIQDFIKNLIRFGR